MENKTAFKRFAPTILQVYHRDKEAFWQAVMAPFLVNKISLADWLQHIQVDVGLLSAFRGLDDDARQRCCVSTVGIIQKRHRINPNWDLGSEIG